MNTRITIYSLLALLAASSLSAAAPLRVTLALEPATTLPALPVTFRMTVSTESAKPVAIPRRALLTVTPSAGEPFIAGWQGDGVRGSRVVADLSPWVDQMTARKGSPAIITIPVEWTLASPAWFADSRLAVPGTYALRVLLDDDLTEEAVRGRQISDLARPGDHSEETELTIREPVGADAVVWDLLQASSKRPFTAAMWVHASQAAKTIWTDYPDSTYARYIAARVPGTADEMIAAAKKGLEMNPPGPLRESFELYAADREMLAYAQKFGTDRERAKRHGEEAVRILSRIAERGHEPRLRKLAAARLAEVRESMEADFAE